MKTNTEALSTLYDKLANTLSEILTDGKTVMNKEGLPEKVSPDAATLTVIRQFLKDAGVSVAPNTHEVTKSLASSLPFPSQEGSESLLQ